MNDDYVFVVDDDVDIRDSMRMLLEVAGFKVRSFTSAKHFLADDHPKHGCLIADIRMPDMSGLELQEEVTRRHIDLPVIIITGHGDVPLAVQAMKAGAIDFLEKPFSEDMILTSVRRALEIGSRARGRAAETRAAKDLLSALTPRERGVLDRLVQGRSNKVVAHELGIAKDGVHGRANLVAHVRQEVTLGLIGGVGGATGVFQGVPCRCQLLGMPL